MYSYNRHSHSHTLRLSATVPGRNSRIVTAVLRQSMYLCRGHNLLQVMRDDVFGLILPGNLCAWCVCSVSCFINTYHNLV
jgi:hypothetical protein